MSVQRVQLEKHSYLHYNEQWLVVFRNGSWIEPLKGFWLTGKFSKLGSISD